MESRLFVVHALTPLHAGTGQGVGVIDLPIAREKATELPYVPGSTVKGVLRSTCEDKNLRERVFGPDTDHADEFAGAAQFTDARLLLLPVRSVKGTFAWVTSPFILTRLQRDLRGAGIEGFDAEVPITADEHCRVCRDSEIVSEFGNKSHVIPEDLDFLPQEDESLGKWALHLGSAVFPDDSEWQRMLRERLCLVSDAAFDFLTQMGTQIDARIRLEESSKTVAKGALWYEESLPAETVLSGLVVAMNIRATADEVLTTIAGLLSGILQVGGKATVGRGLCRVLIV